MSRWRNRASERATPRPTTVLVVDDHTMVREGIRAMLGGVPELEVVGEADDELSTLGLLRDLRPDVVLLDVHLRGVPTFGLCGTLLREAPDLTVLFISAFESRENVWRARRAGGHGFLMKSAGPLDLLYAIHRARQGAFVLDPSLVSLAGDVREAAAGDWPGADLGLTIREGRVLQGMIDGESNERIAIRLGVSVSTVRGDVRAILAKLGVTDRAQAIRVALDKGLRPG